MYLPDEILELIFSYLDDLRTLYNLGDIAKNIYIDKLVKYRLIKNLLITPSGDTYVIIDRNYKYPIRNIKNFYKGRTNYYHLDNGDVFTDSGKIIHKNVDIFVPDSNSANEAYMLIKGSIGEIFDNNKLTDTITLPSNYKKVILYTFTKTYIYVLDKNGKIWRSTGDKFTKMEIEDVIDITYIHRGYALTSDGKVYFLSNLMSIPHIPFIVAFLDKYFLTEDELVYDSEDGSIKSLEYKERTLIPFDISTYFQTEFYLCNDGRLYIFDTKNSNMKAIDLSNYP